MSEKIRSRRYCEVCGAQLKSDYYYTGRCALHQTTKAPDIKLGRDVTMASSKGLSYGQYMAAKREGVV